VRPDEELALAEPNVSIDAKLGIEGAHCGRANTSSNLLGFTVFKFTSASADQYSVVTHRYSPFVVVGCVSGPNFSS
jgi:hypothetical protein